jgi:hypothetical protein
MEFIKENADYRKRCLYLQEIISLSRFNDVWRRALAAFFDSSPADCLDIGKFSLN